MMTGMNRAMGRLALAGVVLSLLPCLGGCSATPSGRARESAAAFNRLSSEDRARVLRGEVRVGMDRATVSIAWGPATRVEPAGAAGGPWESWVYTHAFRGADIGYFGARRGWVYSAKAGRYFYHTDDYYEAPPYIRPFGNPSTDVPYRRAWFDHGTLVHFESAGQSEAPTLR